MHLWPRGRRNVGPFQDVPPIHRTPPSHRLEPNTHHRTARRMADTVPDNQTTRHHPQADKGTRGGPQGARPQCSLHDATHPRGRPSGHGSAHATDSPSQDSGTAHLPHPQIPAACSHPAPNGPGPPPQTPFLQTVRTYPATYHPARDHPPCLQTIHQAQHRHGTHEQHRHRMRTPQAPMPPHHRPSTGTANHQPPRAPSVCANGYHRQPYPATQTTGFAWAPHSTSTPCPHCGDLNLHPHTRPAAPAGPPPPATPASSGDSPTPSGTT